MYLHVHYVIDSYYKPCFTSAQIPVECVAIVAGVDRIVDMGRTVMSITGDASCAVVMNNIFKGQETASGPDSE